LLIKLTKFSFPFTYGLKTGLKFMVGFWSIVTAIIENQGLAHFLNAVFTLSFQRLLVFFELPVAQEQSFAERAISS
jgi:hypothetical protein